MSTMLATKLGKAKTKTPWLGVFREWVVVWLMARRAAFSTQSLVCSSEEAASWNVVLVRLTMDGMRQRLNEAEIEGYCNCKDLPPTQAQASMEKPHC